MIENIISIIVQNFIVIMDQTIIEKHEEEINLFTQTMLRDSDCFNILFRKLLPTFSTDCFDGEELRDFMSKYIARRETVMKDGTSDFSKRKECKIEVSIDYVALRNLVPYHLSKKDIVLKMLYPTVLQDMKNILDHFVSFKSKIEKGNRDEIKKMKDLLPITKYRDIIMESVASNQITIIIGSTGCGKSTQVPQYFLEAGYKRLACTQPRRISTISLCRRVSYETNDKYGNEVGYKIRFDASATSATRIIFLTEGVLLRELASDPTLSHYDIIICDEIHERHVSCDFLLGLLKVLLLRSKKLKLVLMSATVDSTVYSNFFGEASIINIPGRSYKVDVEYFLDETQYQKLSKNYSLMGKNMSPLDTRPYIRLLSYIEKHFKPQERGDLLVFLSGMADMLALQDAIKSYVQNSSSGGISWIVLLLHSSLSSEEQDKVFAQSPELSRKCVLATNIAESAVTIDGIRFVADSGRAKEMKFDSTLRINCLREGWINKASAEQRKGRAGRTGPGVCFRMYPKSIFDGFVPFSTPEILFSNLDSLLLQIKYLGMKDPRNFPFITSPNPTHILASLQMLATMGALNFDFYTTTDECSIETDTQDKIANASLSNLGNVLAKLPIDPLIGKFLILGYLLGMGHAAALFAAILSVTSPFEARNNEKKFRQFDNKFGDPFAIYNSYRAWLQVKAERKTSSRKWCRRNGIVEQRMYDISKLVHQYMNILNDSGVLRCNEMIYKQSKYYGSSYSSNLSKKKIQMIKSVQDVMKKKLDIEHDAQSDADEDNVDKQRQMLEEETSLDGSILHKMVDTNSLEFYSKRSLTDLNALVQQSSLTDNDVEILLLMLGIGLYPQFAIPDPSNKTRRLSECQYLLYRNKYPVFLSPDSIFSAEDVGENLICYGTVLDTYKPQVGMISKMKSFHTLMISSLCIDIDLEGTTYIFDESVLCRVVKNQTHIDPYKVIVKACEIKLQLHQLLQSLPSDHTKETIGAVQRITKLEDAVSLSSEVPYPLVEFLQKWNRLVDMESDRSRFIEDLRRNIVEFCNCEISVSVQCINRSVVGSMRKGGNSGDTSEDGAITIIHGVTWNNIQPPKHNESQISDVSNDFVMWTCPICGLHMKVNQHQLECHRNECISVPENEIKNLQASKRRKIIGTKVKP